MSPESNVLLFENRSLLNKLNIANVQQALKFPIKEPINELSLEWPLIAGFFALIALFLSTFEVYNHLVHYNKPNLQKYIVRILWMVPIYALNSWFAMFFPATAIYLDTLRECYEAFVIYSFLKYLFNFLKSVQDYEILIDCKPKMPHLFPFCFLPPLPGGRKFILMCRHGMIQYIVIRPITTFLALIFELFDVYGEGVFSFKYGYLYLLIVNNISQMIAMYCLVIFYHNFKKELYPIKPLGKFLCIKAVVFFSFFQGVLLTLLINFGIITRAFLPSSMDISNFEMARNLQDFLICFEMLVAAIAHTFVFSHKPFVDETRGTNPMLPSLSRVVDLTDERFDVNDYFRHLVSRVRNFGTYPHSYGYIEDTTTPLIPMEVRKTYGGVNNDSTSNGYQ